ncbi:CDP-glucose 4,6-dehydratase [Desulfopila sp. IMCC35008]|uniref:CDP-glucose 4,6-dehydratase n=1 Tax=Desulfopila sp. IMCC35008 TaxID=2653858 RepID=UPI0013D61402|nr:CDP-glucose 4,6-dehydratase [Desulfopila sp. IMCC35008]
MVSSMFSNTYKGKRILITGDTGFKGSWLVFWLQRLGAEVFGLSLKPPSTLYHSNLLDLDYPKYTCNLSDIHETCRVVKKVKPDTIFHLAAQSLVRKSYQNPYETFQTNIMGTASLLEAVRECDSVKTIIVATSDKCYHNTETGEPFKEDDPLGGHDPYSASKGAVEIVAQSYRSSFLNNQGVLLSTVRAGNVIGGGDWGADRLLPDLMKSASQSKTLVIRSPNAVRPWQHVLEPLSGYLLVGERLYLGDETSATAWNFGPTEEGHFTVEELIATAHDCWQKVKYSTEKNTYHEATLLKLSCKKAEDYLQWQPIWEGTEAIVKSVEWYRSYYEKNEILTEYHFDEFVQSAKENGAVWVN